MVVVKSYKLPPTALIPNSPQPLLHYPGFLLSQQSQGSNTDPDKPLAATEVYDIFSRNDWRVQWIFRYGPTQQSHYHSAAHECMAVLSGSATIRFGVADTVADEHENTYGDGHESGGVELHARAGDVFVLPAGTAHKTYATTPEAEFALLTPGDGHHVAGKGKSGNDVRAALAEVPLDGFTMIGAYPPDGQWDFKVGGEDEGVFDKVWKVPKPENDPVLGRDEAGLVGLWT